MIACVILFAGGALGAEASREAVDAANRGLELARHADYRAAVQAYRRAVALDPTLPGIYLNLGLAWFKLGDFREAAGAFEKEIRRNPTDQATTLLAMSYFGMGRYGEAAARLRPLAEAQPGNTELNYLVAKCYVWSAQYEQAMATFRKLLEVDPNSAAVHMLMGEALDAQFRTEDAIVEFELAAKNAPSQPNVHFGLGYLYWKRRKNEEAAQEFRKELEKNPNSALAAGYLGDVLLKRGSKAEALTWLKLSVSLQNNLHVPHVDLGILYADDKKFDLAVKEFRAAIAATPDAFDAHYRLARAYQEMGKTELAEQEFAAVKKLHREKDEEPLMRISGPPK